MSYIMYMNVCVCLYVRLINVHISVSALCIPWHGLIITCHAFEQLRHPQVPGPVIGLDFSYPPVIKHGKLRGIIEHKCVILRGTVKLYMVDQFSHKLPIG